MGPWAHGPNGSNGPNGPMGPWAHGPGSIQDRSRIDPGSIQHRSGIDPGSNLDRSWIDPGSIQDRSRPMDPWTASVGNMMQTHAISIGKVSSCQLMRFPSARSAIANSCNLNWQGELLPAHTISICKVSNCQLTPTLSDRLTRITCLYTERGGAQSPKAASASTRGGDSRDRKSVV